jgi:amino acid transporter
MTEEVVFARRASGLVRELTFQDVFLWAFAAQAASGWTFYSVRMAYSHPGSSAFLAFFITSLILLPLAIAIALLSIAMPRAGGGYVWVSRIINPTIAFWAAWIMVIGWGVAVGLLGFVVTGLFGGALIMGGVAGLGPAFISAGEALGTTLWQTVGGIAWVIFFWVVSLAGIRAVKWVERVLIYLPLIASALSLAYLVGMAGRVPELFNSMWGSNAYQKIIDAAAKAPNGWTFPSFSWSATIGALFIPFWAWTAFDAICYVSGEVKSPTKTFKYAYVPGYIFCMFLYCFAAWAVYYAYGDFIGAYVYLFNKHPDVLKGIMPAVTPSVPFLAGSLTGSPWMGMIIGVLTCLWYANSILPIFLVCSRVLFAAAFDRAIPEKFSEVNARGAPTWASHITAIWGIAGVLITAYGISAVLGVVDFTMFNFFWLYGLAALLLPYLKPEIFKRSPIQWSVGGIPVISIVGALSIAAGFVATFIGIMEFDATIMAFMSVAIAIGCIIYAWKQAKNVKEGVDISKIYSEIPPA